MKSARFASLLARAGRPEHHLAWSEPTSDQVLIKAAKQHRLLTVHQQVRGSKADFGAVGLEAGRNSQYYIFPRSLKAFAGSRIVAIDYEAAGEKTTASLGKGARKAGTKSGKVISFPAADSKVPKPPTQPKPPQPAKRLGRALLGAGMHEALKELDAGKHDEARARLAKLLEAARD